jgi:hypothetical protein
MNVFISYGDSADQVTALRLQALGVVNGFTVYVPPAYTRQHNQAVFDPDAQKRLLEAEVILGVIGGNVSETCRHELMFGETLQKTMIVLASPNAAGRVQGMPGVNVILMDPTKPGEAEVAILGHLGGLKAQQSTKDALLGLGILAVGLVILATATSQDA